MKAFELSKPSRCAILSGGRWLNPEGFPGDVTLGFEGDTLMLSADNSPVEAIRLEWETELLPGAKIFGDAFERGYGDMGWRGIEPERCLPWYTAVDEGGQMSFVGVMTGASAMVSFFVTRRGVTMMADVMSGNQGVVLGGKRLEVCRLAAAFNRNEEAFDFLKAQLRRLCPAPKLADHPIYGGNNWYYAYGRSSQEKILSDSAFIAQMSEGLENKPYMVIDDGWQLVSGGGLAIGGPWVGNRLFPDMEGLAGEMKRLGVRPGIWMRPLMTSEQMPKACVRTMMDGASILDPTHPATLEYVSEAVRRIVGWGYELIKHDYSTYDVYQCWGFGNRGWRMNRMDKPLHDRSLTTAQAVRRLYETISGAAGSARVIGCNTIGHLGAGIFEIQRTGDDTSGRIWERTRRMGINTLAMRMPQNRVFYDCDADCVGLTREVDWKMNRQWLELLAKSGTPLFVSVDPDIATEEHRKALREAFAIASKRRREGKPLDWQDNLCPEIWDFEGERREFDFNEPVGDYAKEVWWR